MPLAEVMQMDMRELMAWGVYAEMRNESYNAEKENQQRDDSSDGILKRIREKRERMSNIVPVLDEDTKRQYEEEAQSKYDSSHI